MELEETPPDSNGNSWQVWSYLNGKGHAVGVVHFKTQATAESYMVENTTAL